MLRYYKDKNESYNYEFRSWEEFVEEAQEDKKLRFFLNYTNLSKEMFEVAKANYGMMLTVTVDYVKYTKSLKKKLKEKFPEATEEELNNLPLLTYMENDIAARQYDIDRYVNRRKNRNANIKQVYREESTQNRRYSENGADASRRRETYLHK